MSSEQILPRHVPELVKCDQWGHKCLGKDNLLSKVFHQDLKNDTPGHGDGKCRDL